MEYATKGVTEECKRFIRSVLLSKVGGIRLVDFQKDYKKLIGYPLAYKALGYHSLKQLIEDIPDVARIKNDGKGIESIFGILDNPKIMNHTAKKAQYIPDETPGENGQVEVFMGNVPFQATQADIWHLLKGYDVLNIRMKENIDNHKKFCFILVPNIKESEKIANAFHKTTFKGRILVVQTSNKNVENRPAMEDKIILNSMKKKGVERTMLNEEDNYRDINECPPPLEKFIQSNQIKYNSDRPPGLEPLSKDWKNERFDDYPPGLEVSKLPDHQQQQQRRPEHNSSLNDIIKGKRFTDHPSGLQAANSSNRKHQERKITYNDQSPSGKKEIFGSNRNQHHNNRRAEMNNGNPAGFGNVESSVYYAGKPPRCEPADLPGLEKINSHPNRGQTRAGNFTRGEENMTQYEGSRVRQIGHYGDGDRHRPHEESDKFDLYVANFPYGITENELMEIFEPYGATHVKMKNNQGPGKTYCFVVFENYDDASECFTNLDGEIFYGRTLNVCFGHNTIADENELVHKLGNFRCTVVTEGGSKDNEVRIVKLAGSGVNKKEAKIRRDWLQGTGGKGHSFKPQRQTEQQQFKYSNHKPRSQQQDGNQSTQAKQDLRLSAIADLHLQERERRESWETVSESSLPGTSSAPGSSDPSPHVRDTIIAPSFGQTYNKEDTAPKAASKYHPINRNHRSANQEHIPESMRVNNLKVFLYDCFPGLPLIKTSDLPEIVDVFVRISEGNSYFWGQLVNEEISNTIHDMLMVSQLEETGSLKSFDFSSNRATALFQGEWYRVWVKGCIEDEANVFFVDWGNTETVFTKDLRHLPDELWNAKPLAIPFKLQGHESLEEIVNERVTVQVLSDREGILAFRMLQENLQ